jgi:drug/metabolite transporter (DMT)-like permease
LLLLAYLGTFQIGLAYVLLTRGVRSLPALDVALLMVLEPVLSSFWAFVVHHEVPGAWALAGCAVILAATVARIVWQAAEEPEH